MFIARRLGVVQPANHKLNNARFDGAIFSTVPACEPRCLARQPPPHSTRRLLTPHELQPRLLPALRISKRFAGSRQGQQFEGPPIPSRR